MIRKDFWVKNNFAFPEANRMEDLAIYSLLFAKATKASFIYKPLYIYRANPCSIMHSPSILESELENYTAIAESMTREHIHLGTYASTKYTLICQLEYHAYYLLNGYNTLTTTERSKWETVISNILKSLFHCKTTAFNVRAFGWGSESTGLLCSILTKQTACDGKYTSKMTLRGMANQNISTQLKKPLYDVSPNVIIIDLLAETDYLLNWDGDIGEYLKQWALGAYSLKETLHNHAKNARIIILEKYLATKHFSENEMIDFSQKEDIITLNSFLKLLYKSLNKTITGSIFIHANSFYPFLCSPFPQYMPRLRDL